MDTWIAKPHLGGEFYLPVLSIGLFLVPVGHLSVMFESALQDSTHCWKHFKSV